MKPFIRGSVFAVTIAGALWFTHSFLGIDVVTPFRTAIGMGT